MIDLKKIQKAVYQNKVDKGFNTSNIYQEFCLLYEEVGEAYQAYDRKLPDLPHELADVAIFILGIAEILDIDLEQAIQEKLEINKDRVYTWVDGVPVRS